MLITLNSDEHNFAREVFRNISNENHFHTEKVRFVYIYQVNWNLFVSTSILLCSAQITVVYIDIYNVYMYIYI